MIFHATSDLTRAMSPELKSAIISVTSVGVSSSELRLITNTTTIDITIKHILTRKYYDFSISYLPTNNIA